MAGEGNDDPHAVKLKVIWHTNAGSLLFLCMVIDCRPRHSSY